MIGCGHKKKAGRAGVWIELIRKTGGFFKIIF